MSGHTPGPWDWKTATQFDEDGKRVPVIIRRDSEPGIAVMLTDYKDEVMQANARLIAAAPRMYDRIVLLAKDGDAEAVSILESINAGR